MARPAPPLVLLGELGGGLLAVAELGGRAANDEEGEQQEIAPPVQEGVDQEPHQETGDDSRAVHRARRVGRAGERRVGGGGDREPHRQAGIGQEGVPAPMGEDEPEQEEPGDQRHAEVVVQPLRQRFERGGEQGGGEAGRQGERPTVRAILRRRRPDQQHGRGQGAEKDVGERAHPALPRVPGKLLPPDRHADDRGHAVAEGEDPPGRRRHLQPLVEDQDQQQHGERIEEDTDRGAGLHLVLAPELAAADARQQEEVEAERAGGENGRPERAQIAQGEGDRPHAHVDDLARQLATSQCH